MNADEIRAALEALSETIARLEGREPDPVAEHFVHGRVGGSGNARQLQRLNRARSRGMERAIDRAVELVPLYRERERLRARLEDVESGRAALMVRLRREAEARVRDSSVGDVVEDHVYGIVRVARVNPRGLTIQTDSGYREARPWSMIADNLTRLSERDETLEVTA